MAQKYTKKYLHTPSSRRFAFHSSSAFMFVMSYSDTPKGPMMSFTISTHVKKVFLTVRAPDTKYGRTDSQSSCENHQEFPRQKRPLHKNK